ncbi:MAG: hypothetical protein E6246_08050 [Veillonella sp.]|nr:hypothetical protein [Veillonella sp.]
MIRKFDAKNFKWDGIETLVYKQDGSPFKDVTRQVLYDFIEIPGKTIHQFRANKGDYIGFLCLVNQDRDKVKLLSPEEMEMLRANPKIKEFLESC